MKKLFVTFAIVVLATMSALAQHNAPVTATSQFDCRVIAPLTWTPMQTQYLDEVIAGQTRLVSIPVNFQLNGEALYDVTVTRDDTWPLASTTNSTVKIDATWGANITALDATGKGTMTLTVTKLISTDNTVSGTFSFTINVGAKYTAL